MPELRKRRVPCPPPLAKTAMAEHDFWLVDYEGHEWTVICGRENIGHDIVAGPDERWHLSIASSEETPPWDVVAAITHSIRPGVPMALGIPPRSWWLNVHEHTLHCWEVQDENLLGQWRDERRGETPT